LLQLNAKRWRPLNKPQFGIVNQISNLVTSIDDEGGERLPDFRLGTTILVGSDYSSENATSDYEVTTFVFADIENGRRWETMRQLVRRSLPDDRRFAFKNLGDRQLSAALGPFVSAADEMPGLVVTVLIHKRIQSLFKLTGKIRETDVEISAFPGWKPKVMERLLRVAHLVSLFLAGLSRPLQKVIWVTDQDAIVANEAKHRDFVTMVGRIASHYLPHNLLSLRVATTASDSGKRDVEDFVAIADLACGAFAEVLTGFSRDGVQLNSTIIVPPPAHLSPKTVQLMNWLSDDRRPLKKICFAINPIPKSTALSVQLLRFHGMTV
jgi:hypothetical protein